MLYTIAEIAATLAGFATLASVIGTRGLSSAKWNFIHLWSVVLVSLALVLMSLAPVVIADFGISSIAVWRASSAIALVLKTAGLIGTLFSSALGRVLPFDWFGKSVVLPVEALTSVLLLANIIGISEAHAGSLFLVFLLITLVEVVVLFLRLLAAAFMPKAQ